MITSPSAAAAPTAVTFLRASRARPAPAAIVRAAPVHAAPRERRRIWALDASRVGLIAGAMLRPVDARSILGGVRDEADEPWADLVAACAVRGALAEEVEDALDRRAHRFAALVEERPMIEVAEQWSRSREELGAPEVAALLWCLSRDPRPHLEKLASRVAADLCARALRLARGGARP